MNSLAVDVRTVFSLTLCHIHEDRHMQHISTCKNRRKLKFSNAHLRTTLEIVYQNLMFVSEYLICTGLAIARWCMVHGQWSILRKNVKQLRTWFDTYCILRGTSIIKYLCTINGNARQFMMMKN